MDVEKAIRMAVDTGKVKFGSRNTLKSAISGDSKMIIISNNCPRKTREDIEKNSKLSKVYLLTYTGTSLELGSLCGKPFPVSSMAITDAGNSNILELTEKAD